MKPAHIKAMQEGRERAAKQVKRQHARDWVDYRAFLKADAEHFAKHGYGLSWAHVRIPQGSEYMS